MRTRHQVLIIDDDATFIESTGAVLESEGYLVDSASGADEGLTKMAQQKPDLVLLDVMMGWPLEGVSMTRLMMANKELRDIPIIMVTCIRKSEYRGAFPQDEYLHIDSWLDKPCAPAQLLSEIAASLTRHRGYRAVD